MKVKAVLLAGAVLLFIGYFSGLGVLAQRYPLILTQTSLVTKTEKKIKPDQNVIEFTKIRKSENQELTAIVQVISLPEVVVVGKKISRSKKIPAEDSPVVRKDFKTELLTVKIKKIDISIVNNVLIEINPVADFNRNIIDNIIERSRFIDQLVNQRNLQDNLEFIKDIDLIILEKKQANIEKSLKIYKFDINTMTPVDYIPTTVDNIDISIGGNGIHLLNLQTSLIETTFDTNLVNHP